MSSQQNIVDAYRARIAELEAALGAIIAEVGQMAADAEEAIFADTGNSLDFDGGRRDGLQDAITTIGTIVDVDIDTPLSACQALGHSWAPQTELFTTEGDAEGTPAEVLRCRICGYRCHTPTLLAAGGKGRG